MRFRVNGLPAPQGSKRHVGGGRMVEMSRAMGPWREAVRAEAQAALKLDPARLRAWWLGLARDQVGGLSVTIVFILPRPQGHFGTGSRACTVRPSAPKFPVKRPDVDKLVRATLDGLQMGGVMADDAQVVSLNACKVFARDGEAPGAVIDVEAMTGA